MLPFNEDPIDQWNTNFLEEGVLKFWVYWALGLGFLRFVVSGGGLGVGVSGSHGIVIVAFVCWACVCVYLVLLYFKIIFPVACLHERRSYLSSRIERPDRQTS